jgi:iron complex outermembrane receptor protein
LQKKWSPAWASSFYYSYFSTTIGILRGSHIGNLRDLNLALENEEPYFTEDEFIRELVPPKQEVEHHLAKFETKYLLSENKAIRLIFASQINDRKEFDIRRGGRSEIPALSLSQWAHSLDVKYSQESASHLLFKTGLQAKIKDNTNQKGTGFSPLIPDFRKWSLAAYAIAQKDWKSVLFEFGARVERQSLFAFPIINTIPPEVLREERDFTNFSISTGLKYRISETFSINFNTGLAQRSPEINELFSDGLHQGVSGIERGSFDLTPELSLKSIVSLDYKWKNKAFLNILAYHQNISDFIFLEPQREFELTIRGAFPLFLYKQTNARIYGLDANILLEPVKHFRLNLKYAYIKGMDLSKNQGLINIPGNNANIELSYFANTKGKLVRNFQLSAEVQQQYQQNDITIEQDFVLPPESYTLLNFKTSFDLHVGNNELNCSIAVQNALNLKYRDYLNRLRYFADETGRNIVFRVNYKF